MKRNQFRETGTEKDAIVAISTPLGIGGIGIVRMSGPQSIDIAVKYFVIKGKIKRIPMSFIATIFIMEQLFNLGKIPW